MPRVIRGWNATQGDCQRFALLCDDQFVVGRDSGGNAHVESVDTCSLDGMLKGELDDVVRKYVCVQPTTSSPHGARSATRIAVHGAERRADRKRTRPTPCGNWTHRLT
jgi:hypothetical protein